MNDILNKYTKAEISRICEVTQKTVYNWFNKQNMPWKEIEKLGFEVSKPWCKQLIDKNKCTLCGGTGVIAPIQDCLCKVSKEMKERR